MSDESADSRLVATRFVASAIGRLDEFAPEPDRPAKESADVCEREAFEAALDAKPDDVETRLVYADWLADHGDRPLSWAQRFMCHWSLFPRRGDGKLTPDDRWMFRFESSESAEKRRRSSNHQRSISSFPQ